MRLFLLQHRALAGALFALALLVKLLVPAGYMPAASGGIALQLCGGIVPAPAVKPAPGAMQMPGMAHHTAAEQKNHDGHDDSPEHPGADMPCAFAGLALPSLAAVDPLLLAIALALIVAAIFRVATTRAVRRSPHLRPYLRGPPVHLA